ncbi:10571_t:CDS:2, partial [Rhizophagus irregularis]
DYDTGRGDWGHIHAKQEAEHARRQKEKYEAITIIPSDNKCENREKVKNPYFREGQSDDEDKMQTGA